MRIDITGIAGIDGAYMEVSRDISTETLGSGMTGIELGETVHADLKIEYMEGIVTVRGKVTGGYSAQCGRCLKDIKDLFDIEIDENFIHMSVDSDNEDDYLYDGGNIDLTIPLIDNILLSFPGVILCDENCKGLCDICGTDLNVTQCSCERHDINIKMEKLKDFFNQ
jgi:uncharacterized protein